MPRVGFRNIYTILRWDSQVRAPQPRRHFVYILYLPFLVNVCTCILYLSRFYINHNLLYWRTPMKHCYMDTIWTPHPRPYRTHTAIDACPMAQLRNVVDQKVNTCLNTDRPDLSIPDRTPPVNKLQCLSIRYTALLASRSLYKPTCKAYGPSFPPAPTTSHLVPNYLANSATLNHVFQGA